MLGIELTIELTTPADAMADASARGGSPPPVAVANARAAAEVDAIVQAVSIYYNVTASYVRRYVTFTPATATNPTARINLGHGPRIPLVEFHARQTPAGVRFEIIRGQERIGRHMFGPEARGLSRQVFVRGRGGVRVAYGPSIQDMLASRVVQEVRARFAREANQQPAA